MIDYVSMKKEGVQILEENLLLERWRSWESEDHVEAAYYHNHNGVTIKYSVTRNYVSIEGKPMMLLENTEVQNVDDVFAKDASRFVDCVNAYINSLFKKSPGIDIRQFRVTRIDFCFNVETPYVREYVDFFNKAFRQIDKEKRKNYTLSRGLKGSAYIKTNADYAKNVRRNYVLNFYDKTDRLEYRVRSKYRVPKSDFEYAKDKLRLEVQCGPNLIKQLKVGQTFESLFDYKVAFIAQSEIYNRIFHCGEDQDYFTYEAAKERIPSSRRSAKGEENAAMVAMRKASQGQKITANEFRYAREQIKKAGVFPFCFLDKNGGVPMLENPLRLIRKKLEEMGIDIPPLNDGRKM